MQLILIILIKNIIFALMNIFYLQKILMMIVFNFTVKQ